MRALQRIASACLCLPLAVGLVPAAALAAPEPADSAAALAAQASPHNHVHVWEWEQQDGSSYILEGYCPVCEETITNVVPVNVSGARKTSELRALVENSIAKFKEDNRGTGLDDISPVVSLRLSGNTVIAVDADLEVAEIGQGDNYVSAAFSLTVRGDGEHALSVTDGGTWLGGDFTIESGKFNTSATTGTALYAAGSMSLVGGQLAASGKLRGIFSGGDITVRDPARIEASAGYSRNTAAAIYCGGTLRVESGNIMSASGLHGIYSVGNIVIAGGEVNASVNASDSPEPALFSRGAIDIDLEKVKIDTPEDGNLGLSNSSWTGAAQDVAGSAVLKDNVAASVVKIVDGTVRDAAFYENFGKPVDTGEGTGADGGTGTGTGAGTGTGTGTGSGTSGTGTGSGGDGGSGAGTGSDSGNSGTGTGAGTGTGGNSGTGGDSGTGADAGGSANTGSDAGADAAADVAATVTGESDASGTTFRKLRLKSTSTTKNSVKLTWKAVTDATRYIVFGTKCGVNNRYKLLETVAGTSYTDTGLKKNTYYRYFIVALDESNRLLSKSKTVHAPTLGGKYSNIKKVNVSYKSAALAVGDTLKLTASVTKSISSATLKAHVGMRYESSNKKVATVGSAGKITAKGAGTCTIYSYAQNGVFATTKVTVL